jgi:hypothetical protein
MTKNTIGHFTLHIMILMACSIFSSLSGRPVTESSLLQSDGSMRLSSSKSRDGKRRLSEGLRFEESQENKFPKRKLLLSKKETF